ncbi:MAG: ATP-dependent DNA helicase, partial [Gammaproteobacteria bacterium]
AAVTSGGTIPDQADFDVILEPEGQRVGSVNEDFAIESLAGDIFQLGNTAYRILRVAEGKVRVADAKGQPPNIPFWFGEAPARTDELSAAVSRLRAGVEERLHQPELAHHWLAAEVGLGAAAAHQIVAYLGAAKAALGGLPTLDRVVFERFFDEAGDQHLVIHSTYGGRINRAWGLALRKRFCRTFNFELQAAATEDAIVLSLGATHSFALEEPARYLKPDTVREVLIQALLAAPMFEVRWRWNATIALAIARMRAGKRVAPQLQRMQAEDLVAVVFPDQLACLENIAGDREVPDHPLVNQTIQDCLTEVMDIDGLQRLLTGLGNGRIELLTKDTVEPSPLAQAVLVANPYAFLDDAPAEERRTLAVQSRRWAGYDPADDLGRLDPQAIERVRREAWPEVASVDELHDALMLLGCLTVDEAAPWSSLMAALCSAGRATRCRCKGIDLWVAAERLHQLQAVHPHTPCEPALTVPPEFRHPWALEDALRELVRGRLEGLGPVTAATLVADIGVTEAAMAGALAALEQESFAMRGRYTPDAVDTEWCDRRLLARIHRYTLSRLRAEIEPVPAVDFMRFLLQWQHVSPEHRGEGEAALLAVIDQLEGFHAPAASWESELLAARMVTFWPHDLDTLCQSGRVVWVRMVRPKGGGPTRGALGAVRATPIALMPRRRLVLWQRLAGDSPGVAKLSATAGCVERALGELGASFFDDLQHHTGLLRSQLEQALGELVAAGRVHADRFAGLRALIAPVQRRRKAERQRRQRMVPAGVEDGGRWALVRRPAVQAEETPGGWRASGLDDEALETIARVLLRRYGVVFRRLLEREADHLPPWRELLWIFHRLEARGEVRGGRFVAGFSGEQFALPEAVGSLRRSRKEAGGQELVVVSAVDPLNLVGILTPDERVPALSANRVLYRQGVPVAVLVRGEVVFLADRLEAGQRWRAQEMLVRGAAVRALREGNA